MIFCDEAAEKFVAEYAGGFLGGLRAALVAGLGQAIWHTGVVDVEGNFEAVA
ncbi:MAG: hypothetical protein NVSMB62_24110 [Acidobacteriaceae bacterium]